MINNNVTVVSVVINNEKALVGGPNSCVTNEKQEVFRVSNPHASKSNQYGPKSKDHNILKGQKQLHIEKNKKA